MFFDLCCIDNGDVFVHQTDEWIDAVNCQHCEAIGQLVCMKYLKYPVWTENLDFYRCHAGRDRHFYCGVW